MKKNILSVVIFTLLAALAHADDEFVPGELLVGFRPGTRGALVEGIRNGLGANIIKGWPEIAAEHWRLPHGLEVAKAIEALSANPNVLYAEPNLLLHATDFPN